MASSDKEGNVANSASAPIVDLIISRLRKWGKEAGRRYCGNFTITEMSRVELECQKSSILSIEHQDPQSQ